MRHFRPYRVSLALLVIASTVARYLWLRLRARLRLASDAAWQRAHARTGRNMYRLATHLGGAFVKLGQVLGARNDVFPESFLVPLRALHDRVPPRPLARLRDAVERELGKPLDAVFTSVDDPPLAAASLSQVHRARLLAGDDVVLKIQYPEAQKLFPVDFASLKLAVRIARRMRRGLDLRALADELAQFVLLELDFSREARSTERIRAAFAGVTDVQIPRVYAELSTERVLVLEYLSGEKLSDIERLRAEGVDLRDAARRVASIYATMIFRHGFFQGDPHPGNLLLLPGGGIGLLDFGLAKELPPGFARGVAAMVAAAVMGNAPALREAARAVDFELDEAAAERLIPVLRALLGTPEHDGDGQRGLIALTEEGSLGPLPGHFALILRVLVLLSGLSHRLAPGERIVQQTLIQMAGSAL